MSRFVVWPGVVYSRTDGQGHWISGPELLRLHRVPKGARVVYGNARGWVNRPDDIPLFPRDDGQYQDFSGTPKDAPHADQGSEK
jgi:hypothetical protein